VPISSLNSASTTFQDVILHTVHSALPALAAAVLMLVAVVAGVWFILRLFGFRVGLSETAKQRIRSKAAARRAQFPFQITRANNKAAESGRKWVSHPVHSVTVDHNANLSRLQDICDAFESKSPFSPVTSADLSDVEYYFELYFGHIGSISGLANSAVELSTKMSLFRHAARLSRLKASSFAAESTGPLSFAG